MFGSNVEQIFYEHWEYSPNVLTGMLAKRFGIMFEEYSRWNIRRMFGSNVEPIFYEHWKYSPNVLTRMLAKRFGIMFKYVLAPGEYQRHRISNLLATNILKTFACFNFCFNVLKANIKIKKYTRYISDNFLWTIITSNLDLLILSYKQFLTKCDVAESRTR